MEKITCNVIKDLLPLYIDDVLSEDSRNLVENHLETCESCRAYYDEMNDDAVPKSAISSANETSTENDERTLSDKRALKGIKKKLIIKRLVAIALTALAALALALGVYYLLFYKQRYMPYEETELYVKDNCLHATNSFYASYSMLDCDNTLYIYLTTTYYQSHKEQLKDTILFDNDAPDPENESEIGDEASLDNATELDNENAGDIENEIAVDQDVSKIYYVTEPYAKSFWDMEPDEIDAARDDFILVWEAK